MAFLTLFKPLLPSASHFSWPPALQVYYPAWDGGGPGDPIPLGLFHPLPDMCVVSPGHSGISFEWTVVVVSQRKFACWGHWSSSFNRGKVVGKQADVTQTLPMPIGVTSLGTPWGMKSWDRRLCLVSEPR